MLKIINVAFIVVMGKQIKHNNINRKVIAQNGRSLWMVLKILIMIIVKMTTTKILWIECSKVSKVSNRQLLVYIRILYIMILTKNI